MKKRERKRIGRELKTAQQAVAELFRVADDVSRQTSSDRTRAAAAIVSDMAEAMSDSLLTLRDVMR
jgi:hypothetical protein